MSGYSKNSLKPYQIDEVVDEIHEKFGISKKVIINDFENIKVNVISSPKTDDDYGQIVSVKFSDWKIEKTSLKNRIKEFESCPEKRLYLSFGKHLDSFYLQYRS